MVCCGVLGSGLTAINKKRMKFMISLGSTWIFMENFG